jgi:glycine/D-amino acid oxidase-like deaminating enzyme
MVVNNCDLSIIGGGIQGLFLAYYAKKRYPNNKIILFESKIIGSGITAYSGHLHLPYGNGEKNVLTKDSLSLYSELCIEHENFPLEKREFTGICKKENLDSILLDITDKQVSINSVKNISDGNIMISGLNGFVSRRNISSYLMEIITKMGVIIYEGTEIVNTKKNNNDFELITQTGYKFTSPVVLNSSGASIFNLLKNTKDINLRTKKIIAFHINHSPSCKDPITYFFDDDAFILPQPYYSRCLFSYKCEEWDIDIDPSSFKINQTDIENAEKVLNKYTNDFSTKILGGQVYMDLYNMPSSSPLIHELENNYFAVGATGGSGVRLAPALAIKTLNKIKQ